jgi:DNA-binding LacI/PurR family transcriptional regulator
MKTKSLRLRRGHSLVSAQLRDLAVARGAGNKLPTVDELCESLGTSRATLDNALSELEARNIVLRKRGSGIYVSPKIGYKNIAVAFSHASEWANIVSPFWGILQDLLWQRGLERAPQREHEYSFHLLRHDVGGDRSSVRGNFEDMLAAGRFDGVLCVRPDEPLQHLMTASGIPIVGFAVGPEAGWSAGFDIVEMFRLGVEHLIQQGCRRIMMVPAFNFALGTFEKIERISQSSEALIEDFRLKYAADYANMPRVHQDFGEQAAAIIFGAPRGERPDGLIVLDDMVTDGLIKALYELDIRPGRDVRIASHANTGSPVLRGWERRLTLIESDPDTLVSALFETLDILLDGGVPERRSQLLPWAVRVDGKTLRRE